ncbi:hypothetical protein D3C72_1975630 [compost metagenome]
MARPYHALVGVQFDNVAIPANDLAYRAGQPHLMAKFACHPDAEDLRAADEARLLGAALDPLKCVVVAVSAVDHRQVVQQSQLRRLRAERQGCGQAEGEFFLVAQVLPCQPVAERQLV